MHSFERLEQTTSDPGGSSLKKGNMLLRSQRPLAVVRTDMLRKLKTCQNVENGLSNRWRATAHTTTVADTKFGNGMGTSATSLVSHWRVSNLPKKLRKRFNSTML